MKRLMVISVVVSALFCLSTTGVWADGSYLFRSYSQSHESGYDYSASLACKGGHYIAFVKGYNDNPRPTGNEMIDEYVTILNAHEMSGVQCYTEHEVLADTWRGFRIVDEADDYYYIFKSYPDIHKDGYDYSASLACKGGYYVAFVKGYENNPNPIDDIRIKTYVSNINKKPENGSRCYTEHEVLEGTWRGFRIISGDTSGSSGGGCFITTAGTGM